MSRFIREKVRRIALVLAAVAMISGCFFFRPAVAAGEAEKVRKPAVAGMFYPGDPKELKREVTEWLNAATSEELKYPIKAIMAPHAGYRYCGSTMAAAFKQIAGPRFQYDTVVMIGPSHRFPTKAAAVSSAQVWETPLGAVPVASDLARRFTETSPRIEFDDRAHALEHSLEVQLPFLQAAAAGKPFRIVPLVTNSSEPEDRRAVADALIELAADRRTLIIISTDLSHFPDAQTAERVDKKILRVAASLNADVLMLRTGRSWG